MVNFNSCFNFNNIYFYFTILLSYKSGYSKKIRLASLLLKWKSSTGDSLLKFLNTVPRLIGFAQFLLWHPQWSWGDILLFYISFFVILEYTCYLFQAVLLTTNPVPTSFNEPVKVVKGDNSCDNNVDTPKVNPQRKPVPEEGKYN